MAGSVLGLVVGGLDGVIGMQGMQGFPELTGTVLVVTGVPMALASIPFFATGRHKKENAYQVYNEYCVKPAKPTASLSFGPATKGIGMGIYLNF